MLPILLNDIRRSGITNNLYAIRVAACLTWAIGKLLAKLMDHSLVWK